MTDPCRDLLDQVEPEDLTQIALQMLFIIERMELIIPEITDTIRKALEQGRPTPQPVAVSERLPGPKDCEAGECWAWDVAAESWNRTHYALCNHFTHWLPANALPTPEGNDN